MPEFRPVGLLDVLSVEDLRKIERCLKDTFEMLYESLEFTRDDARSLEREVSRILRGSEGRFSS